MQSNLSSGERVNRRKRQQTGRVILKQSGIVRFVATPRRCLKASDCPSMTRLVQLSCARDATARVPPTPASIR